MLFVEGESKRWSKGAVVGWSSVLDMRGCMVFRS